MYFVIIFILSFLFGIWEIFFQRKTERRNDKDEKGSDLPQRHRHALKYKSAEKFNVAKEFVTPLNNINNQ